MLGSEAFTTEPFIGSVVEALAPIMTMQAMQNKSSFFMFL
jgi:hypothetical protein